MESKVIRIKKKKKNNMGRGNSNFGNHNKVYRKVVDKRILLGKSFCLKDIDTFVGVISVF